MRWAISLVMAVALGVTAAGGARGQATRDCAHCPEMVSIPPGSFLMGAPPGEEERENVPQQSRGRSAPQLTVTLAHRFSLGRYEVTRGEFAVFVRSTGHQMDRKCHVLQSDGKWKEEEGRSWLDPGFAQTDRHPVVCVSWRDAAAYAAWLAGSTGKAYRLPTEAEWEYAARAGTRTSRFWGDTRDGACVWANVADLSMQSARNFVNNPEDFFQCTDGHVHTAPVGAFRANWYGLHDMIGNAWEWTGDCWAPNLTGASPTGAYRGTAGLPGDCSLRVVRGGSWNFHPRSSRAAGRGWGSVGYRDDDLGFRVARTD
ncbi:MAG: formylglycine-generating enzyme family protein [Rhodospirillales bacterium]|nr:MAG: formylglycine-generating enzyme family protein [Rhodospirillales bacterium]